MNNMKSEIDIFLYVAFRTITCRMNTLYEMFFYYSEFGDYGTME
ncbi:hypothetical protein [Sporosarcina sp. SAFN-010]